MSAAIPVTALSLLRKQHSTRDLLPSHHETAILPLAPTAPPGLPLLLSVGNKQKEYRTEEWIMLNKSNGNGITEISGEAGSGKSQLCLSLCVSCAMSKTKSTFSQNDYYHAMYISMGSEGNQLSQIAHRLHQMIQERIVGQCHSDQNRAENDAKEILKRIHTKHVHNEEEFIELLKETLPPLLQNRHNNNPSLGLLVFDSIAGIFRTREEENTNISNDDENNTNTSSSNNSRSYNYYAKRSELFFTIASQLKRLSDLYNVHIVIVNQVTTTGFDKTAIDRDSEDDLTGGINMDDRHPNITNKRRKVGGQSRKLVVKPSLGLAWSCCVNDRYILSRSNGPRSSSSSSNINSRNDSHVINSGNHRRVQKAVTTNGSNKKYVRTLKLLTSSRFSCHDKEMKFHIEPCGVVMLLT